MSQRQRGAQAAIQQSELLVLSLQIRCDCLHERLCWYNCRITLQRRVWFSPVHLPGDVAKRPNGGSAIRAVWIVIRIAHLRFSRRRSLVASRPRRRPIGRWCRRAPRPRDCRRCCRGKEPRPRSPKSCRRWGNRPRARRFESGGAIFHEPKCRFRLSVQADPAWQPARKDFSSVFQNYVLSLARPAPPEGRLANRRERWGRMRWTRRCRQTSDVSRGRRNRVVLISRRWDQACETGDAGLTARHAVIPQVTVAKKPGHRLFDAHIFVAETIGS